MAPRPPRPGHRCCAATAVVLVTIFIGTALAGLSNTQNGTLVNPEERLAALEAQVATLQEHILLLGGAVHGGDGSSAAGARSFVPQTGNTRRMLAARPSLWPQHWTFLSAVTADAPLTSAHVVIRSASSGPRAVVLGDSVGRLYIFSPDGLLLHEYDAGHGSPVTALASTMLHTNSTQLAVGLEDGVLLLLSLEHDTLSVRTLAGIIAPLRIVHTVRELLRSTPHERAAQLNTTLGEGVGVSPARQLFFTKAQRRQVLLSLDADGGLTALLLSSGRVLLHRQLQEVPLAGHLNTDYQLMVQTATKAVIALLRHGRGRAVRPCGGLLAADGTVDKDRALVAATIDMQRPGRAYGVTRGGELLLLSVPSAQRTHLCRVLQRTDLGLPPGAVRVIAVSGHVLLLHSDGVADFAVGSNPRLSDAHAVSHTWAELWALYGLQLHAVAPAAVAATVPAAADAAVAAAAQHPDLDRGSWRQGGHSAALDAHMMPAAAGGGLLVLPLGSSSAAFFAVGDAMRVGGGRAGSGLASSRSSGGDGGRNAMADWTRLLQPLVVVAMVVVGVWQYSRASSPPGMGSRAARARGHSSSWATAVQDDLGGLGGALSSLTAEDLGQMGMMGRELLGRGRGGPDELGGVLGSSYGNYSTRRAQRRAPPSVLDGGGPLAALTARRRARQLLASGGSSNLAQQRAAGGFARAMADERAADRRDGAAGGTTRRVRFFAGEGEAAEDEGAPHGATCAGGVDVDDADDASLIAGGDMAAAATTAGEWGSDGGSPDAARAPPRAAAGVADGHSEE